MAYSGPEIDELYEKLSQFGAPSFDKSKLSRPPVKIVLEIVQTVYEATNHAFPALEEMTVEFTAEEKQERLDYISHIIELIQAKALKSFSCEAKNVTSGKEVEDTLAMLIVMCDTAKGFMKTASFEDPNVEIEDDIIDEAPIEAQADEMELQETEEPIGEEQSEQIELPVVEQRDNADQVSELFTVEPQPDDVTDELINHVHDRLNALIKKDLLAKSLQRPPVKFLQEIFADISDATHGKFPDENIIVRQEFAKEEKEERLEYIQNVIDLTREHTSDEFDVQAKSITSGKEVAYTLYFLIVMCRVAENINSGKQESNQQEDIGETQNLMQQEEVQSKNQNIPIVIDNDSVDAGQPEQAQEYEPQADNNFFGTIENVSDAIATAENPEEEPQLQEEPLVEAEKIRQIDEEEEQREFLQAEQRQKELEAEQQRRLTNAFQDVKTAEKTNFARPPPSQQKRRQAAVEKQESSITVKNVIIDSDSEDNLNIANNSNGSITGNQNVFAAGFEAQQETNGAFTKDIMNAQQEFNAAIGEKQPTQQNTSNLKLLQSIQDSIRKIIPFSKATSFLEEHLVRMRQELTTADDEAIIEGQKQQKEVNLDLKQRSVIDAKVRSLGDQAEQVRANYNELAQLGLML